MEDKIIDYALFKPRRKQDTNFRCACNFNPLCIMSLGGALGDFLYHTFRESLSNFQNWTHEGKTDHDKVCPVSNSDEDFPELGPLYQ